MKSNAKKTRVTLDLSPEFYRRLQALEELVEADSKASLIRQALQLYEFVAKRTVEGTTFRAVSPEGEEAELVFLGPSLPPSATN